MPSSNFMLNEQNQDTKYKLNTKKMILNQKHCPIHRYDYKPWQYLYAYNLIFDDKFEYVMRFE